MRLYCGQTRSRSLVKRFQDMGIGECCNPHEWPPRRTPIMFDNAEFTRWRNGIEFDPEWYGEHLERAIESTRSGEQPRPDIVIAPDQVAQGMLSFERSVSWRDKCAELGPVYLAVQDGMDETVLDRADFDGVFVGGSLAWKLATGGAWCRWAHERALPCHIGRCVTPNRIAWARRIGADSIDGNFQWSHQQIERVLAAFFQPRQMELYA